MLRYLAKSALLIGISVVVVCGVYPGILWVIGQTLFPFQTNGSIVRSDDGKVIGSLLVAQPFTKDEYFQPRPVGGLVRRDRVDVFGLRALELCAARPGRPRARADRHLCVRRQEGPARRPRRRGVVQGGQGGRKPAYRRAMGRRP